MCALHKVTTVMVAELEVLFVSVLHFTVDSCVSAQGIVNVASFLYCHVIQAVTLWRGYCKCVCRASVSSFAYQGTNSHMVVAPSTSGIPLPKRTSDDWLWHRTRFWFQSTSHPFLHAGSATANSADLRLWAASPSLAYLWDHCIQVWRPLCAYNQ